MRSILDLKYQANWYVNTRWFIVQKWCSDCFDNLSSHFFYNIFIFLIDLKIFKNNKNVHKHDISMKNLVHVWKSLNLLLVKDVCAQMVIYDNIW
jgi:hypothetical protein